MTPSFTRTTSGLRNYAAFFQSDITIFVEGKQVHGSSASNTVPQTVKTSDELFHQSILNLFCPNKRFKIKSVGCKNDLSKYAEKILVGSVRNCAVVFDSDYETVLGSWAQWPRIMRTSGYSWENDMWTPEVCERVISLFAGGREWDREKFHVKFRRMSSRLERLSRIEVCCRAHGINLIVPNGKSVGIALNGKEKFGVSLTEIKRLIRRLRSCIKDAWEEDIIRLLLSQMRSLSASALVRGHLWEAVCVTLISNMLKDIGIAGALANDNVKNVALGVFTQSPDDYLDPHTKMHYRNQLTSAGYC